MDAQLEATLHKVFSMEKNILGDSLFKKALNSEIDKNEVFLPKGGKRIEFTEIIEITITAGKFGLLVWDILKRIPGKTNDEIDNQATTSYPEAKKIHKKDRLILISETKKALTKNSSNDG